MLVNGPSQGVNALAAPLAAGAAALPAVQQLHPLPSKQSQAESVWDSVWGTSLFPKHYTYVYNLQIKFCTGQVLTD